MSPTSANAEKPISLRAFIETLVACEPQPMTVDDPPWFEPGQVCEVEESIYRYFFKLRRRKHSNWFAFGERAGPFRLFWRISGAYFARELTDDETRLFCELSQVFMRL